MYSIWMHVFSIASRICLPVHSLCPPAVHPIRYRPLPSACALLVLCPRHSTRYLRDSTRTTGILGEDNTMSSISFTRCILTLLSLSHTCSAVLSILRVSMPIPLLRDKRVASMFYGMAWRCEGECRGSRRVQLAFMHPSIYLSIYAALCCVPSLFIPLLLVLVASLSSPLLCNPDVRARVTRTCIHHILQYSIVTIRVHSY